MAANNANSLDDQGRLLRSEFTNNFLLMSDVKGLRREVNSTTRKLSVVAVGNGSLWKYFHKQRYGKASIIETW